MRITQGTFSYLPDFTDEEIRAQLQYVIDKGWAVAIEFTDDPHPRNSLWEMWGLPMFDISDAAAGLSELNSCREAYPNCYVRVTAYDPRKGRQTVGLSFIVHRPDPEPGFRFDRAMGPDRQLQYSLHPYAAEVPHGQRYGANGSGPNGSAQRR